MRELFQSSPCTFSKSNAEIEKKTSSTPLFLFSALNPTSYVRIHRLILIFFPEHVHLLPQALPNTHGSLQLCLSLVIWKTVCHILLVGWNFTWLISVWFLLSYTQPACIPGFQKQKLQGIHTHSLGLQSTLQMLARCWLLQSISKLTFHSEILESIPGGVDNAYVCLSKVLMNKVVIIAKAYLMKSLSMNNSR